MWHGVVDSIGERLSVVTDLFSGDGNLEVLAKIEYGDREISVISQLNTNYIKNKMSYRPTLHIITGHCGLNKHLYTIKTKIWPN